MTPLSRSIHTASVALRLSTFAKKTECAVIHDVPARNIPRFIGETGLRLYVRTYLGYSIDCREKSVIAANYAAPMRSPWPPEPPSGRSRTSPHHAAPESRETHHHPPAGHRVRCPGPAQDRLGS